MYVIERVSYDHSPPLCVTNDLSEAKMLVKLLGGPKGVTYYKVPEYAKGDFPGLVVIYQVESTYLVPEKYWSYTESQEKRQVWEFDLEHDDTLGGHWAFNWEKTYGFLRVWGLDKNEVDLFFLKAKRYLTEHPDTPARPLHNFKKLKEFNG